MTTGDVTAGRVLWEAGESPAEFRARLVHYVFAAGGQVRFGIERLDLMIFSMSRDARAGTISLTAAEAARLCGLVQPGPGNPTFGTAAAPRRKPHNVARRAGLP